MDSGETGRECQREAGCDTVRGCAADTQNGERRGLGTPRAGEVGGKGSCSGRPSEGLS